TSGWAGAPADCDGSATALADTLSLHDALPICKGGDVRMYVNGVLGASESDWPAWSYQHQSGVALLGKHAFTNNFYIHGPIRSLRSEEHTSELQSRENLVCRLLLEKKKNPTQRS